MSLILKGLPQVSQDGQSVWTTDTTGEYAAVSNEGGWGSPNFALNESALLFFIYRMAIGGKELITPSSSSIKHSETALNTQTFAFQGEYRNDGHYEFHNIRLMVSTNDINSIDSTPVVFTEGDIWYNRNDGNVKQFLSGSVTILDISNIETLDTIIINNSVTSLICDQLLARDLAVEKANRYQREVKSRRDKDSSQENRMIRDQTAIQNRTAAASYQFSFGLKVEAQHTIESLLDDFNLS